MQLVELEDLDWIPRVVRDGGTDLLDLTFDRMGFYEAASSRLWALVDELGATRVVDLCSGGGGGAMSMRRIARASGRELEFLLTDRFPNEGGRTRVEALGDPRTRYLAASCDAMAGGGEVAGVRTMFSALHHFRPHDVSAILAGIIARGEPLAFFDVAASPALRRLPLALAPLPMAMNLLALFTASLALTPFAKPRGLTRYALTYALPVIPTLVAWDGTVSALRAYTPDELRDIARATPGAEKYTWDVGVAGRALYVIGRPARA